MRFVKTILIIVSIVYNSINIYSHNDSEKNDLIKNKNLDSLSLDFRCMTETFPTDIDLSPNGQAEVFYPLKKTGNNNGNNNQIINSIDWTKADSLYFNKIIPARANCGIKVNKSKFKLEMVTAQNLTENAQNAVKKSPDWIRAELENTLSQLIPSKQNQFAQVVLDAEDPYIDEIAFAIAHSSTVFLASDFCFPQLFAENAKLIYAHDQDLQYVEVVDYGNSQTEANYYSTVYYYKIDSDSNKVEIEVPKEIYYWYIVHPKLSDEISTYVFPDIIEYDYTIQNSPHTLNIATPEDGGVFWREFLYIIQDDILDKPGEKFPQLKEEISKCDVLYNDISNGPSAIKSITKWINDVMNFNSEYERPHQPVRIYRLHLGRCGEHEDITAAAARACLIPCRGVSSWSTDHVWNEFWDEKWWQWEPVNNSIKNNMVYESGWGKKFGSVIARRSDGLLIPVTEDYSVHTCKINVFALDLNNKPIDGAFLLVGMGPQNDLRLDSWATTDSEGKYSLIVGKDNSYWVGMSSALGNDPSNGVRLLIDKPNEGEEYNFSLKGNKAKQLANYNKIEFPIDTNEDFKIMLKFDVTGQVTNWKNYFDDLANTYCYGETSNGLINFFVSDEPNYEKSTINQKFDVCLAENGINTLSSEFALPDEGVWYAYLNNRNINANYIKANGWFSLYYSNLVGIEDDFSEGFNLSCYPNPFSSLIRFELSIKESSQSSILIFNKNGQLIKCIVSKLLDAGKYFFQWDGTNQSQKEVSSDIYFVKFSIGKNVEFRKISLIR